MESMELQSGLGKVSVMREVSALQRCWLREVPLYMFLLGLFSMFHAILYFITKKLKFGAWERGAAGEFKFAIGGGTKQFRIQGRVKFQLKGSLL